MSIIADFWYKVYTNIEVASLIDIKRSITYTWYGYVHSFNLYKLNQPTQSVILYDTT